jgi:hypothetical protein
LLIGATIGAGALIGAGAGSAFYGATHTQNFNTAEWAAMTVGGAGSGAAFALVGIGAFAAGAAAGSAVAGAFAGAVVGGAAGAGLGAGVGAAQYGINEAFGVKNQGSLSDAVSRGALVGGIGGAVTGGLAGYLGGVAATQSAIANSSGGNWDHPLNSYDQLNNAFNNSGEMGLVGLPSTGRWILTKSTNISAGITAATSGAKCLAGEIPIGTTGNNSSAAIAKGYSPANSVSSRRPDASFLYGRMTFNPSMSSSVGLPFALITQPTYWGGSPIMRRW